jgi:putative transposase
VFPVETMCKVLKVSRSSYYGWLQHRPGKRAIENEAILQGIKDSFTASKGRYGSPRITSDLTAQGLKVSRPRVARLMKKAKIQSIIQKKYRVCTTDSNHSYPIAENYLNRAFSPVGPAQAWVSDLTYIQTKEGWLYLTIIMDLFDRKIIGWSVSESMKAVDTSIAAWKMAVKNRSIKPNLIFHSDRGIQYACHSFTNELKANPQILQSMSQKGNCWDNAVAESFFKTLKSELVYQQEFQTKEIAKLALFEYIEIWYNRQRRHSTLSHLSPLEYNQQQLHKVA